MITLNINKPKKLTFEVQMGGVNSTDLRSLLRIKIGEVEYGFPAKFGNETISVEIPALNKVVASKIKEGYEAEARLEVITDGQYVAPWSDRITFQNPLVVEAKIVDDELPTGVIKTKLISEDEEPSKKEIIEEKSTSVIEKKKVNKVKSIKEEKISKRELLEMTKEDVIAYMERAGTKTPAIQNIIYEQAESKAQSSRPVNVLIEVVKILKHKND